jgi:hypothetical protein
MEIAAFEFGLARSGNLRAIAKLHHIIVRAATKRQQANHQRQNQSFHYDYGLAAPLLFVTSEPGITAA